MKLNAYWEMGQCIDEDIIFLSLKGRIDSRYSHFHLAKSDVKLLIRDLQTLLSNQDNKSLRITKKEDRMELELGNVLFNTNKNQSIECPKYIIALLRDIDRHIDMIMWNINQEHYDSPFQNTGNKFSLGNFEIQAYSWDDEIEQEYNFIYRVDKTKANMPDLKISWYKYLGRDTTINQEIDSNVMTDIYTDIIKQLDNFHQIEMNKKGHQI